MAVIQQANSYKTVVGWYGDCSDEECQDINLSTYKPHITSVYQWDNSGVLKVWKSNLPDTLNRAFKTLECGKLYYLYVKPGTGSFTIPNFVVSSYETEDAGRIAALCQSTPTPVATPTPVPCDCASSDFVTLESTSSSAFVSSGHTFGGFEVGTKISYQQDTLSSALASEVTLVYSNGQSAGIIVFSNAKPNNTQFIVQRGITCYTATATSSNESGDDTWQLTLQVSETLSSNCGDADPLSTPTPVPAPATYTLSANPTTPAEGNNISVVLTTENVENGTTIPYTITGVGSSDITIPLTGNFTISGGGDTKFIGIVADQVTEGNETLTLKLDNNQAEVSVVIQDTSLTQQTPTPVVPGECCPSSTTSLNTNGDPGDRQEYAVVLPGQGLQVSILIYAGWNNGGKLCIDVSDMQNAQENSSEIPRFYSLPYAPSVPLGYISRPYNNSKNTFYYTIGDDCYVAEYEDAGTDPQNPVVMTKTSGTSQPDPDPTPTPVEPTPTPEKPEQVLFRWKTINVQGVGEREVLQVKNVLKPTHPNFSNYLNTGPWTTVYGYTGNDGAYSLNNSFWPDVAVPSNYLDFYSAITFDGMTISLGAEETDATIGKYKQLSISLKDEVEFSHDSNESSPSYLFMYKEDINTESLASGASGVWPVIVKKPSVVPAPNVTGLQIQDAVTTETRLHFTWFTDISERTFTLEFATDSSFQNIVSSSQAYSHGNGSSVNQITKSGLNPATTYYFRVKGNPINNETSKSVDWAVVSGTTKPEPNNPTPTPADCTCVPDDFFGADITSDSMVVVAGQVFAAFPKGSQVGYDNSSLATDISSTIFFKHSNNDDAGVIALSGGKPNNTKFTFKDGNKCYSVTVGASNIVNGDYVATWVLQDTLPASCADASFSEEYNCCSDYDTKINVMGGRGEFLNGVQVTSHPDGRMDGNICFNAPGGYVFNIKSHTISFEGLTDTDPLTQIKLDISIDYDNVKFIYRLKSGECYEGYLNNTYNSTFTEVT